MATLRQLCTEIEADLRALTGIRQVQDPADALKAEQAIVVYPESGVWYTDIPGGKVGLHNIAVELYIPRAHLFTAYQELLAFAEVIPNALLKALGYDSTGAQGDLFNNTVDGIAGAQIPYTFEVVDVQGVPFLRCRWVLQGMKQQSNLT